MKEESIEIISAEYSIDCVGSGRMNLYYHDSAIIVFSGYRPHSLDTIELSGKYISVASDMQLKFSGFNSTTGKWFTHYKHKVIDSSLRWCGIKHISGNIYELPTIDFKEHLIK